METRLKDLADKSLVLCIVATFLNLHHVYADDLKCSGKDGKFKKFVEGKSSIYEKLKGFQGKSFSYKTSDNKFTYSFGICSPPLSFKDPIGSAYVTEESKVAVTLGVFTDTRVYAGSNWVMLKYHNTTSDPKGSSCSSSLMLICNSNKPKAEIQMFLIEGSPGVEGDCNFLFELEHPDICTAQWITFSLSIGSILVIAFVCILGIYIIGGVVFMRMIKGAKGWAQVPNVDFWKDFGNLQADGCNFLCRSEARREPRPYKGIGDDQLEDNDHDDHLLPM